MLKLPLTPLSTDWIWCLHENKVFNPNLTRAAQERDFCKLHDLALDEVKFLEDFCSGRQNRGV